MERETQGLQQMAGHASLGLGSLNERLRNEKQRLEFDLEKVNELIKAIEDEPEIADMFDSLRRLGV